MKFYRKEKKLSLRIITIVGARPQFIKAAAFSRTVKGQHTEILVHTGQHFDPNMSAVFFEELQIPRPAYNLEISGKSHGKMTGAMIAAIEEVLIKEKPNWTLVYGDTNSTIAGALASVKLGIPVAHVEAGIRLGTLSSPEEVNRIVTDHVSQVLFAPTELELNNLQKENLDTNTYVVGNIMYDSYLYWMKQIEKMEEINLYDLNGQKVDLPEKYYYLTCHRQENTYNDVPLREVLKAMNQLDNPTIYPVHPRNQSRVKRLCLENNFEKIRFIQPVGYRESLYLLKYCEKVVTDSGGLQCEAFYTGKQCITIFDRIVWPQTMVSNRNQLSKAKTKEILEKLSKRQVVNLEYQPFGNGHTADKIIKIMEEQTKKKIF